MSGTQVIIALEEGLSELLIAFPIENHINAAVNLLLPLLFEYLSLLKARFPLMLRVVTPPLAGFMMMAVPTLVLRGLMPDVRRGIPSFLLQKIHSVGWSPRHVMVFLFGDLKMVRKTSRNFHLRFLGSQGWLRRINFNHGMRHRGELGVKSLAFKHLLRPPCRLS